MISYINISLQVTLHLQNTVILLKYSTKMSNYLKIFLSFYKIYMVLLLDLARSLHVPSD